VISTILASGMVSGSYLLMRRAKPGLTRRFHRAVIQYCTTTSRFRSQYGNIARTPTATRPTIHLGSWLVNA